MIHPTAIISPEASLDSSVVVGPYVVIEGQVEISAGTQIDSHSVIKGPCRIGKDNHIYSHAVVGEIPQDLKFHGEHTTLEIGDRNQIREFSSIHRGTEGGGGVTRIGSDVLIMAYAHIAHDCQIGDHVILANAASLAGHVTVGDHAIFGGFAVAHQFCRIGAHAFIGGFSKLSKDVPPFVMADGARARSIGLNKEGLRRRHFDAETIALLNRCFRQLVKKQGDEMVWAEFEQAAETEPALQQMLDFIKGSERGITR
ncbi:MAG: acyl-[acyl-carrier-protein]--UDP-N-acetylglucosamine O-acyltransferase [Halothiobacillus sp. 14-56-357]|uniref:acyl-ACP--UDP-N-acetylglucosamine O-acyltransferase n=1 Tax=Halothiobacillus sp. 15-55-196 TaxID=1970382 RepID=UPI000BC5B359|nr:acyl-ACP--UDP-N-acetylglucosamine O-acyltransferase [Halothiobacillus sp. 15-55-196]OZB36358.1 MAG: acyl-[acyl-carrier-protein]--UDP-N-acetylglucosamine O-acyltransferase [Halothiobacillus sp. 15-55-196]OZB55632.1 MAG: acyl-[acyl-carrier-protein]--UDP-N-acetylglucosamine O-acyltransferase [Halothiobacillus sp. 14-56-357]OZB77474.1 MAG: acyl-[acyl-carrier-protein]--UDP-N-acetylglucosamine O-acyltransferase [Halothiobacillus sp. 13-55-115]